MNEGEMKLTRKGVKRFRSLMIPANIVEIISGQCYIVACSFIICNLQSIYKRKPVPLRTLMLKRTAFFLFSCLQDTYSLHSDSKIYICTVCLTE